MPDRRKLLALTLAGLALRAAFLVLEPTATLIGDERMWVNWAVDEQGLLDPTVRFSPFKLRQLIFYPPLYPYFIAVVYASFATLTAVKWAQVLASALLIPAVGRVAAVVFGPAVGVTAAAITSFHPDLVWFSVHFWSETLFMALLWWAFERLLAADARARLDVTALAGVFWGFATLARETALYFAPVAALWLAWKRSAQGGSARAAVFLLATVLTVAPWTYRNWLLYRTFIPVSTAGGLNLYQGNTPLTRDEVYAQNDAIHGRVEQYRWMRQMGIRAILDRQPLWIFEKLRDEMPSFWEADNLALVHLERLYGDLPAALGRLAWALIALPHVLLLALFALGLAALRLERNTVLLIAFLVFYNLLHVVTHGFSRYRLPIMPIVFMLAASGFFAWRGGSARTLSRGRRVLLLTLSIVLALCVLPSLRRNFEHPAFGFGSGAPSGGDGTVPR